MTRPVPQLDTLRSDFPYWEKTGDMIDQLIDLMLNHRQSGHPGGSRSKVPAMVSLTLSGVMRWDIRNPQKAFADRFVLMAGHTTPLIYGMLAVYNEALNRMHAKTGDSKYLVTGGLENQLVWEDLLNLRRNKGLSGHAEAEGKSQFFKANTGPSGHGGPAAVGIALALKHAGAGEVRVFGVEGEGGLTAGAHHEAKQIAYGLGLSNMVYMVDWNDYGIDPRKFSDVMYGTPQEWFDNYGFLTHGVQDGESYADLTEALISNVYADGDQPRCTWFKTTKGRGYGVTGNASHGAAHKPNSEIFWDTKREFADKYGVEFVGMGSGKPDTADAFRKQTGDNIQAALSLLDDEQYCQWLADRLVELGDSVPEKLEGVSLGLDPAQDPDFTDPSTLPDELFFAAGEKQPNRAGFSRIGSYLNAVARRKYGRPLVLAASADLADSTNLSGFAKDWDGSEGFGWYNRKDNKGGALMPTAITEFGNAGVLCGMASTNMASDPQNHFAGYWGACSTYGSFSYLKYGPMRLYSQQAQDSPIKLGKVIWVAGHSGPETAEDSRTHFGIYSPGITQFFPRGQVIDLHPWEPNEVGPALLAALGTKAPIVALHLTRPGVELPDRKALGMGDFREAANGAYIIRDYDPSRPKEGCIFVRGTSCTASLIELLKEGWFDGAGPNVKLVAAISHELFMLQDKSWRDEMITADDWADCTFITNNARQHMWLWAGNRASFDYAMCPDHDEQWRTGGSYDEIIEEAGLDKESLRRGIGRFANEREARMANCCVPAGM